MKAIKYTLLMTMMVSSLASAETLALGGPGKFGQQITPAQAGEEAPSPAAAGEPCSTHNMEIRIEDYDPKTQTYEIIDTKCEGQGPWYSTPEVIGCAVPTLWMKTDPRFFLNKTFTLKKDITFHPEREEARKQGNSINAQTCKKRTGLGTFFKTILRGGTGAKSDAGGLY